MAASGSEIVKAGFLKRQSDFLGRWKYKWFILFSDGILAYYDSNDCMTCKAEASKKISQQLVKIESGIDVTGVKFPSGSSPASLLTLTFRGKEKWILCAESPDDVSAWRMSIEMYPPVSRPVPQTAPTTYMTHGMTTQTATGAPQVTVVQGPGTFPSPYPQQTTAFAYPGQVIYGSQPPQRVVQPPPSQTTIVYLSSQPRYCDPFWW